MKIAWRTHLVTYPPQVPLLVYTSNYFSNTKKATMLLLMTVLGLFGVGPKNLQNRWNQSDYCNYWCTFTCCLTHSMDSACWHKQDSSAKKNSHKTALTRVTTVLIDVPSLVVWPTVWILFIDIRSAMDLMIWVVYCAHYIVNSTCFIALLVQLPQGTTDYILCREGNCQFVTQVKPYCWKLNYALSKGLIKEVFIKDRLILFGLVQTVGW